jgi:hypothetical protein
MVASNSDAVLVLCEHLRKSNSVLVEHIQRYVANQEESWGDLVPPFDPDLEAKDGTFAFRNRDYTQDSSQELTNQRNISRYLCEENEFAINAMENRISYIVGYGFTYSVLAKDGTEVSPDKIGMVKSVIDNFVKLNNWWAVQQEKVMRRDRDGEFFIRYFIDGNGNVLTRFIEPEWVEPPAGFRVNETSGIRTKDDDVQTVEAYCVKYPGQKHDWIDAAEILHAKRNVDSSFKRGRPTFYPVRKNLQRAGKLLQNMASAIEIQTAIAMIRKHTSAMGSVVRALATANAKTETRNSDGKITNAQKFEPGTILDAPASTEYEFPAQGIDPSKSISSLQACLRAVASRLVMPEFMLTSDASNANFASTMVAEGPAVKNFQRLQWDEITFDLKTIDVVLAAAVKAGLLDQETVDSVAVKADPPNLQVRDKLKDAQAASILKGLRIASSQTISAEFGYDYEQEQDNFEADDERRFQSQTNPQPGLFQPPTDPNPDPLNGDNNA